MHNLVGTNMVPGSSHSLWDIIHYHAIHYEVVYCSVICAINLIFTIMIVRAPQGLKNITGQWVFNLSWGIVNWALRLIIRLELMWVVDLGADVDHEMTTFQINCEFVLYHEDFTVSSHHLDECLARSPWCHESPSA
jgi:hypothetical protein